MAAQNSFTSLSARNSQKVCSLHSQLAKAAKNELSILFIYLCGCNSRSLSLSATRFHAKDFAWVNFTNTNSDNWVKFHQLLYDASKCADPKSKKQQQSSHHQ